MAKHDHPPRRETIPPSVALECRRIAKEICHRAKVDFIEWPLREEEITSHLKERWRDWSLKGLNDVEATEKLLQAFGSFSPLVRKLRKPWYYRLLNYESTRFQRYFIFLAAHGLYSWMAINVAVLLVDFEKPTAQSFLFSVVAPLGMRFFLTGTGSLLVGVLAALSVAIIRSKSKSSHPIISQFAALRYMLLPIVILAVALLVVMPTYSATSIGNPFSFAPFSFFIANLVRLLRLVTIVLGLCGAACIIAELCGPFRAQGSDPPDDLRYRRRGNVPAVDWRVFFAWVVVMGVAAAAMIYPKLSAMAQFCEQIRFSDRVEVRMPPFQGIVITGANVRTISEIMSRATLDLRGHHIPLNYDDFEIRFFAGTNLLKTAASGWGAFAIDEMPYVYSATDFKLLRTSAFDPASHFAHEQYKAERDGVRGSPTPPD